MNSNVVLIKYLICQKCPNMPLWYNHAQARAKHTLPTQPICFHIPNYLGQFSVREKAALTFRTAKQDYPGMAWKEMPQRERRKFSEAPNSFPKFTDYFLNSRLHCCRYTVPSSENTWWMDTFENINPLTGKQRWSLFSRKEIKRCRLKLSAWDFTIGNDKLMLFFSLFEKEINKKNSRIEEMEMLTV